MDTVCDKMREGDRELLWHFEIQEERRMIPCFSEMILESKQVSQRSFQIEKKGNFPALEIEWKGSPRWIRESPLVSHGQTGEFRYLKVLGTHDWGMGGNKERAREPSRVCWPRGDNADVIRRPSRGMQSKM